MKKALLHISLILVPLLTSFAQGFEADENLPPPAITIIDDHFLVMEYESIYDIHISWDPVAYPNIRNSPPQFDYDRIYEDLNGAIDADKYHIKALYTDDDGLNGGYGEVPGWMRLASVYSWNRGKNVGFNNIAVDNSVKRGKHIAMPHMNNIAFAADDPGPIGPGVDYPFETRGPGALLHEIGHVWGVRWVSGPAYEMGWSSSNWDDTMPPIVLVGNTHWGLAGSGPNSRWVDPEYPGIMTSGATAPTYHPFQLYAMGILSYEEVEEHVSTVRNPETGLEYEITVDDLIAVLGRYQEYMVDNWPNFPQHLQGTSWFEGDGKRIPAINPERDNFKTLIVVVTGQEGIFTPDDMQIAAALSQSFPSHWSTATLGKSNMTTQVDHKMVNHIDFLMESGTRKISWEDFLSGYNPYKQDQPDSIQVASLPDIGELSYDGTPAQVGDVFTAKDFQTASLEFTLHLEQYVTVSFEWNAYTQGRLAAPATVSLTDPIAHLSDIEVDLKGKMFENLTWEDFMLSYAGLEEDEPDFIKIEALPYSGSLTHNNLAVAVGQQFGSFDFAIAPIKYTRNPGKFWKDKMTWNASTNGVLAQPAEIDVIDNGAEWEWGGFVLEQNGEELKTSNSPYPNPFTDELKLVINGTENKPVKVRLLDMAGREVYSTIVRDSYGGRKLITIKGLSTEVKGLMFLEISQESKAKRYKVFRE